MTTEAKPITREVVCTGKTLLKSNKKGIEFILLDDTGAKTERVLIYQANKGVLRHAKAGYVYRLDFSELTNESGIALVNTLVYDRPWGNSVEAMKWQETERALEISLRAIRKEKNETGTRLALEALMPLHELWAKTDHIGRLALEIQVLNYIRRGSMIQS